MNQIFDKESFPGNMPIRVLRHNIVAHFKTLKKPIISSIKESTSKGKIEGGICIIVQKEALKTPKADFEKKTIILHENFIAYLWALSYSLVTIFEKSVQIPFNQGKISEVLQFNTEELKQANALFNWAITLNTKYSDWDLNLPNPEKTLNEKAAEKAGWINSIFLDALTYIILHEMAHLINGHKNVIIDIIKTPSESLSEKQITTFIELEKEADCFAFENIIEGKSGHQKFTCGVSIVLSHIISLFHLKKPKSIKQLKHPDLDNRILNSINKLELENEEQKEYIWGFSYICSILFFGIHEINREASLKSSSFKELFFSLLEKFDEIKKE